MTAWLGLRFRIRWSTSRPSRPGISRSRMTRSYASAVAMASPADDSAAVRTSYPCDVSSRATKFRILGSSSTIRIRAAACCTDCALCIGTPFRPWARKA